ncbi:MAG: iron uptake porin [Kamptonema sp. SIO4C4]|nr:iron uptake porin [Kamptonema sp. SIO4C4]
MFRTLATSGLVGLSALLLGSSAFAAPVASNSSMSQLNTVSELRDISPGDWAFAALQNLIQRYDCLAGYPDGTFRGNRPLSRYEFAAGLNACLQQIERLLAETTANLARREDLETLRRLAEEFEVELATLSTRVDTLEDRTAFLEDHQFSTTTKLQGEAIFALTDVLTGTGTTTTFPSILPAFTPPETNLESPDQGTVFANRVRLDFLTSFTGTDRLKLRLTSGNFPHPNRGDGGFQYGPDPLRGYVGGVQFSPEGQQTFNDIASLPADNSIGITELSYGFPLGDRARVTIMATGGEHREYLPTTFSSWDDGNGGTGSLSVFGQRSDIYNFTGAGLGLTYQFSDAISFSAGYLAPYANNASAPQPLPGDPFAGGLFAGRYSALAQLTIQPSDHFSFGLTYNHSYHPAQSGFTNLPILFSDRGTTQANLPVIPTQEVSVNSYGVAALWEVSPKFAVNGWLAYSNVNTSGGTAFIFPGGPTDYTGSSADILTYGLSLAFPDLGGEGNLGGIVIGASPYTTRSPVPQPFQTGGNWFFGTDLGEDFTDLIADNAIPWHIEAFYRYKVTDNIFLTPGVIWLTAPNQSARNPDVLVGTLRLTFRF